MKRWPPAPTVSDAEESDVFSSEETVIAGTERMEWAASSRDHNWDAAYTDYDWDWDTPRMEYHGPWCERRRWYGSSLLLGLSLTY